MGGRQRWTRVGIFSNRVEAETARSALSAQGVESQLVGDDGGGVDIPMSLEHQGMEVHVAQSDREPARQILGLQEAPRGSRPMSRLASALIGTAIVLAAILVALNMVG